MSINLKDLYNLLDPQIQPPIRRQTLQLISSLYSSESSAPILEKNDFAILKRVISLLDQSQDQEEIEIILRLLVNATSASLVVSSNLMEDEQFLGKLLQKFVGGEIGDEKSLKLIKLTAMLLSNLTVSEDGCQKLVGSLSKSENGLVSLIKKSFSLVLQVKPTNPAEPEEIDREKSQLRLYSAYILRNLTQSSDVRRILIAEASDGQVNQSKDNSILALLLPILTKSNDILKFSVVDIVRNCCFDTDLHQDLIKIGQDDFLCALLYPLIGGEQLDDDENDSLPIDLQYMDAEKKREPSATIRVKILEALYQFCATSLIREYLRQKGTYYVLREYHKWEQKNISKDDPEPARADLICANVVGVLIRTEEEVGVDNLRLIEDKEGLGKD